METYANIDFSVLLDNKRALQFFIKEFPGGTNPSPGIFLDLNIGQNRCGASAQTLTALAENLRRKGYEPSGLHAYDGHIHDSDIATRQEKAASCIGEVEDSLKELHASGVTIPEVVIGGSPAFPVYAERTPWTLSPGTIALWDYGYGRSFPEMLFEPAAFLLGHIVSIPQSGLLTVDLGVKALSCDGNGPPGVIHLPDGQPLSLGETEKYQSCGQSEEHWILRSDRPHDIGDPLLAVPRHICTTVSLYDEAFVLKGGSIERWTIHRSRKMKCETEQTK